jgi:DNA topoisomerase IB
VLKKLKQRGKPGSDLFEFYEGREWHGLKSQHVNGYIKEVAGPGFSAKDFRTWNATVLCAVHLAIHAPDEDEKVSKARLKRIANLAVRETAEYLNNTPAVCRASYIDPRVFDHFDSGETIRPALERIERGSDPGAFPDRERIERAVLKLL